MDGSNSGDLWVFGYGSLIWRPGFAFEERVLARLEGWRRRFCLRSIAYRGTPEAPGLVLGLDADPASGCDGVAFRVAAAQADAAAAYLRDRELVTYAYRETALPLALRDGRTVQAMTFVIDRAHAQYAGELARDEQAAIIARAAGPAGPNAEYLENTLSHLIQLGLHDPELEALQDAVRARLTAGPA